MNKANINLHKKRYTAEQVLDLCNCAYDQGYDTAKQEHKEALSHQRADLQIKLANAVGQAIDCMGQTLSVIAGNNPY